jgi:2-oxoglutarate dehydrogenase E1 component
VHDYFVNYARQKHARGFEAQTNYDHEKKQVHVLQLINAYRFRGHQVARINPLGRRREAVVEELSLKFHALSESDLDTEFETGSLGSAECLTLREIQGLLEQTYCGTVGSEYMHILETKEKRWIQKRLERSRSRAKLNDVEKINILQQLTDAEGLERYLHSKYVGQKRFSLEGGESLIPLLDELVQFAGTLKIKEVVIGMAHRGRLNVLVNVLGKTPDVLFSEFEGTKQITWDMPLIWKLREAPFTWRWPLTLHTWRSLDLSLKVRCVRGSGDVVTGKAEKSFRCRSMVMLLSQGRALSWRRCRCLSLADT